MRSSGWGCTGSARSSLSAALHAFGSPRPAVAALIIGYATGYALTRRTLPLAGAGVVEALLPFSLVWVGAGLAPAVLAVFLYRIFNLWLPLIPAVMGMRVLKQDHEELAEPAHSARRLDPCRPGDSAGGACGRRGPQNMARGLLGAVRLRGDEDPSCPGRTLRRPLLFR